MQEYLWVLLLVAPGFIAQKTAGLLGNEDMRKNGFDSAVTYFTYSLFSIPISFIFLCFFYRYSGIGFQSTWQDIPVDAITFVQLLGYMASVATSSFLVGAFWQLYLKEHTKKWTAYVTNRFLGYRPMYNDAVVDEYFNRKDKEEGPVLIRIMQHDKQVALGQYKGSSFGDSGLAFHVADRSEDIKTCRAKGQHFTLRDSLVIPQYDMVVQIFDAPEDFFKE